MKFYIDEDVDSAVRTMLTRAGHDAWLTSQAGRTGDSDIAQIGYAMHKRAVVVTHDREMVESRRAMPMCRIIRLDCLETDAADVLEDQLPNVIPMLEHNEYVFIVLSRTSDGRVELRAIFGTESRSRREA